MSIMSIKGYVCGCGGEMKVIDFGGDYVDFVVPEIGYIVWKCGICGRQKEIEKEVEQDEDCGPLIAFTEKAVKECLDEYIMLCRRADISVAEFLFQAMRNELFGESLELGSD